MMAVSVPDLWTAATRRRFGLRTRSRLPKRRRVAAVQSRKCSAESLSRPGEFHRRRVGVTVHVQRELGAGAGSQTDPEKGRADFFPRLAVDFQGIDRVLSISAALDDQLARS